MVIKHYHSFHDGWNDMSTKEYAHFVTLTEKSSSHQPISITHCITINPDLTWKVWEHGHEINKVECPSIQNISDHLNSKAAVVTLHGLASHPGPFEKAK